MKNMLRTIVLAVCSLVATTAPAAAQGVIINPEDFPPKCVPDSALQSGRCVPIDAPFGDFEVEVDRTDLLYVVNVGDDATPYPARGKNAVRLVRLDGATGLPNGNVRIATDYSGAAEINGPEFLVPPASEPNDLGVVYHSAGAPKVAWRRRGATWSNFSTPVPFPFAPEEGYPSPNPPEGLGIMSFFAVPDFSDDFQDCPGGCTVDYLTGVRTPVGFLLMQRGYTVYSKKDHPEDPDLWAITGCDPAGACGITVGANDGTGGLDLSSTRFAPYPPNTDQNTMVGGIHPTTGAVIWWAVDSRNGSACSRRRRPRSGR